MIPHAMLPLLVALAISAHAQQLQGPHMPMPYNLSTPCLTALNTSVTCPGGLAGLSMRCVNEVLQ
jgi:hypothetical protein